MSRLHLKFFLFVSGFSDKISNDNNIKECHFVSCDIFCDFADSQICHSSAPKILGVKFHLNDHLPIPPETESNASAYPHPAPLDMPPCIQPYAWGGRSRPRNRFAPLVVPRIIATASVEGG